jgi:LysM repeat protein
MKGWHVRKLATLLIFCLSLGSLGSLARPVWAAPDHGTYIVQRGDTLFSIARRYGTNVETLQRLNGLSNPHQIKAGQVLIVPDSGDGNVPAAAQSWPSAPPALSIGITAGVETCPYVVQRGDYLYKIARKFGISPLQLARANGLSGASILVPGQVLHIPSNQCGTTNRAHELPWDLSRLSPSPTPTPYIFVPHPESGPPSAPAPTQSVPPITPIPRSDNNGRIRISEPTPTPTPPIRPEVYD